MAHAVPAEETGVVHTQLKRGALSLLDGTVIGVASTAPAYSLTATTFVLSGAIGLWSPSSMVVAFFPMIMVACGFYFLNRRMPNCGTSYAWVSKALHPALGFLTGWTIIIADIIFMFSGAQVAAQSTLSLIGQDPTNINLQLLIGILWLIFVTAIVTIGIKVSARLQWILLGLEYLIVMAFCVWAFIKVFSSHPAGSHTPSLSWVNPFGAPGGGAAMLTAVLGAVFLYWGWDSAVNVNEETEDATRNPGLATILSNVALLIIYVFGTMAIVALLADKVIQNNSTNTLTVMAQTLAGNNKIWYAMVLAVLSSAVATCQTTILPTARVSFSMARDRVIPPVFAKVHPRFLTPWVSTVAMGAVSILIYWIGLETTGSVATLIQNAILAIGMQIAFYYGLTGIASAWYYRRLLFTSAQYFLFAGLLPLLGGIAFFYILVEASKQLTHDQVATGIGAIAVGIPLLIISWIANPGYYRQRTEAAGPDDGTSAHDTAVAPV